MSRPDWDTYFLMIAYVTATRATCNRKHVGAVIVDADRRIVSGGYNGAPSGQPECDVVGHELRKINGRDSCVRTIHAESNALDRAKVDLRGCAIYVTVTPCYECAKRIVNAGITRIVYAEHYASQNTDLVVELCERAGVELVHMPRRFQLDVLCGISDCTNAGRYDSGFCAIHDSAQNAGQGTRVQRL